MNRTRLIGVSLAALLGAALLTLVCAGEAPARAAPAAPDVPALINTFTVNGSGDVTTANSFLTLREALLLARGGTDGTGGLARGLTDLEMAQISGNCTWSGTTNNRHITGGCGAGLADTIVFNLPNNTIISLVSPLPPIDDSAPTDIDGTTIVPHLDAGALASGQNGLTIASNGNTISNLTVENSPQNNFNVSGNRNTLQTVRAWNAGANGILVGGVQNAIENSHVGVSSPFTSCSGNKGNSADGVLVSSGAYTTTVHFSELACNGGSGIRILARSATLGSDQIFQNGRNGLELSGASTTQSLIYSTYIYSNTLDGINERNGAFANWWTSTRTHDNGGLGIDKAGDNDSTNTPTPPYPFITSAMVNGGNVEVRGTSTAATGGKTVYVELYRATIDGEGWQYIAQQDADASGHWLIYDFGKTSVGCYVALQTVTPDLNAYTASEFGPSNCQFLFLPLVRK